MQRHQQRLRPGFTIVELLVVIIIIGILGSITVVAYNGVQQRAAQSAALADLSTNLKKVQLYQVVNTSAPPTYAETVADSNTSFRFSPNIYKTVTYCNGATNAAFGIELMNGTKLYGSLTTAPTIDNTITTDGICAKLGITKANGTPADVALVIDTWTFCANETGTCSFSGLKTVRFGVDTRWITKTNVDTSISCRVYYFGSDPAPGVAKACYYQ